MGQRSQIYIRYPKSEGKKGLIAKYFSCNYGERMISRARHGIEFLCETYFDCDYYRYSRNSGYTGKVSKIFDINFDMQDTAISCDIVKEWNKLYPQDNFNNAVFKEQDNNNGKLFVDVLDNEIKYCFTDREITKVMSAEEYMEHDMGTYWVVEFRNSEYHTEEEITTCFANIQKLQEMATVMTMEELQEFINYDYVSDFDEDELPVQKLLNTDVKASFTTSLLSLNDIMQGNYDLENKHNSPDATDVSVYKLIMGLPINIVSITNADKQVIHNAYEVYNLMFWKNCDVDVIINGKEYTFSKLTEEEQDYLLNRKVFVNTLIGSRNNSTPEQQNALAKVVKNYY